MSEVSRRDRFWVWTLRMFAGRPFRLGHDTPAFEAHLEALGPVALPPLDRPGRHELTISTLAGELDAGLCVLRWHGADVPTVIYHHGGSEIPYTRTAARIFAEQEITTPINAIVIRLPFHRSGLEFRGVLAKLGSFISMLAVGVGLTERVLSSTPLRGSPGTLVAGFSQGGFITNRHHVHYNSADAYVPMMAGTNQGDLFAAMFPALSRATVERIRARLNFTEAWRARDHAKVFPVLARRDGINPLAVMGPGYPDVDVELWDTSHLAGFNEPARLREVILRRLPGLRES